MKRASERVPPFPSAALSLSTDLSLLSIVDGENPIRGASSSVVGSACIFDRCVRRRAEKFACESILERQSLSFPPDSLMQNSRLTHG